MTIQEEKASHDIYRERFNHKNVFKKFSDLPPDIEYLNFWRKQNSHKGIGGLRKVKHLTATAVNDSFFEEICQLQSLDSLVLSKITVEDISTLNKLPKLRYLRLYNLKPCSGLEALISLPRIEKLWISESYDISDFSFLKGAKTLIALGVEGSTWTNQKVNTLEPFSDMDKLEALFMSSVQLKDKDLTYVSSNPKLKYFSVSRFAPKKNFDALRDLRPDIICQWFDNYDV